MEEKLVRRGAENDRCTTLVDQGHALSSATEAMDKHRAVIESVYAVEIENLLRALFVYPLRSMHNERQSARLSLNLRARSGSSEGECAQPKSGTT